MSVEIAMDSDCTVELDWAAALRKPFGYTIHPARDYVILSQNAGIIGYVDDVDLALPVLRMLVRSRWHGHGKFDFRLYHWNERSKIWDVAMRTISLTDMGHAPPAPEKDQFHGRAAVDTDLMDGRAETVVAVDRPGFQCLPPGDR